jgi:hypothetical protein
MLLYRLGLPLEFEFLLKVMRRNVGVAIYLRGSGFPPPVVEAPRETLRALCAAAIGYYQTHQSNERALFTCTLPPFVPAMSALRSLCNEYVSPRHARQWFAIHLTHCSASPAQVARQHVDRYVQVCSVQ